jgi:membrane associated rhomboid family serine protease
MFPLRDTVRSRSFPIVNYGLIAVNVLIFFYESSLSQAQLNGLISTLGMVPGRLSLGQPMNFLSLLTSMFLHGSWFHLISNMWVLYIFGDNVEDRMGSLRYLMFYILAGVAAGSVHAVITNMFIGAETVQASMPTVGASGAIAGVLGAYFRLYPNARVTTLILLFIFPWFVDIPAVVYLGFWFLTQLFPGLLSLGAVGGFGGAMSGIAWWAHIGGFTFGLLMVFLFARRIRVIRQWYPNEYWPW